MKKISDMSVFKVSLVTKENNPAVEEAETKHSIFKMFGGFFKSKNKITKEQETQLDTIAKMMQPIAKLEDGDYLDTILERDSAVYRDEKRRNAHIEKTEDESLEEIQKTLEPIAKDQEKDEDEGSENDE